VGALAFVVRRILLRLVLLWVLSLVTFFLFFKIPADPAGFLVDPQKATPEQRAQARHQLGVDRPVHVQYAKYVRSHALRNMMGPIVTMLGMDVGMAVGIALYIETVFALPGLGRTTIAALAGNQGFDLPVILGATLVVAAAIIVLNLLADLVLLALDPRISAGGRLGSIVGRLV